MTAHQSQDLAAGGVKNRYFVGRHDFPGHHTVAVHAVQRSGAKRQRGITAHRDTFFGPLHNIQLDDVITLTMRGARDMPGRRNYAQRLIAGSILASRVQGGGRHCAGDEIALFLSEWTA